MDRNLLIPVHFFDVIHNYYLYDCIFTIIYDKVTIGIRCGGGKSENSIGRR